MGMKPRTLKPELIASRVVQKYLDDSGGEWSGFKMDHEEKKLVAAIAKEIRKARHEQDREMARRQRMIDLLKGPDLP